MTDRSVPESDRLECDRHVERLLIELLGLLTETRRALQIATLAFVLLSAVIVIAVLSPALRP